MESGCLTLKKLVNLNSNFMQSYTLIFAHNLYDDICLYLELQIHINQYHKEFCNNPKNLSVLK